MAGIRMKRRLGIKIDMTPMVDIAFLLLIFYMTTTTFKPPEKKSVVIPTSHSEITIPDNIISITVTKDDSVFVEYVTKEKQIVEGKEKEIPTRVYEEANLGTLASTITRIRVTIPGAVFWSVVIKADKNSSYGAMADIMQALQSLKISQFHLVTEMEVEKQGKG
jgi:biopolymer transport protein ExbD